MNLFHKITLAFLLIGAANSSNAEETLYQAGTLLNLGNNVYTGSTSFTQLLEHTNLGLGTVEGAVGEMVILDKKVYVGDSHGNAITIPLNTKTPFAMAVQFKPSMTFELHNIHNTDELEKTIDEHLPSKNIFYAIKIEGTFSHIKMRDFDPPTKPYQPLNKWIEQHQHIINLTNSKGTLIVFRSPGYINPISVPGYHFHYLTADHKMVGHVYNVEFDQAKISIEPLYHFALTLPNSSEFLKTDMKELSKEVVTKVENNN